VKPRLFAKFGQDARDRGIEAAKDVFDLLLFFVPRIHDPQVEGVRAQHVLQILAFAEYLIAVAALGRTHTIDFPGKFGRVGEQAGCSSCQGKGAQVVEGGGGSQVGRFHPTEARRSRIGPLR